MQMTLLTLVMRNRMVSAIVARWIGETYTEI